MYLPDLPAGSIRKGALELERYGMIEILRGKPVKRGSSYSEEAQFYRLNPLQNGDAPLFPAFSSI